MSDPAHSGGHNSSRDADSWITLTRSCEKTTAQGPRGGMYVTHTPGGKHETAATAFAVTTVSSMWARGDLNPHVPKDTGT